jgi:hypothetical protein
MMRISEFFLAYFLTVIAVSFMAHGWFRIMTSGGTVSTETSAPDAVLRYKFISWRRFAFVAIGGVLFSMSGLTNTKSATSNAEFYVSILIFIIIIAFEYVGYLSSLKAARRES